MFSSSLELLNEHFKIEEKLSVFLEALSLFNSEDEFFKYSMNLVDAIKRDVSKTDGYIDFTLCDMTKYNLKTLNSEKLYQSKNIGSTFVSIDLKNANYISLLHSGAINKPKDCTYEDFMSDYTDIEHFKKSKYFRQVLFGHLNPKRQQKVQKYIINHIRELLNTDLKVFSFTSDELVIKGSLYELDLSNLKSIMVISSR